MGCWYRFEGYLRIEFRCRKQWTGNEYIHTNTVVENIKIDLTEVKMTFYMVIRLYGPARQNIAPLQDKGWNEDN